MDTVWPAATCALASFAVGGMISRSVAPKLKHKPAGGNSAQVGQELREVRIVGIGSCLPGDPVPNEEVLDECNLYDRSIPGEREKTLQWIENKVGIKTRYTSRKRPSTLMGAREGAENSTLCAESIKKALAVANLKPEDLDLILVATCTPDYLLPSNASIVQDRLGIKEIAVVDIRSACCGAMQAIITATQYAKTGYYKTIAVCGSETGSVMGVLDRDNEGFSRQDFVNAVMIGDGAGCLIIKSFEPNEKPHGIEILYQGMNGIGCGQKPGMWLPVGGSITPVSHEAISSGEATFKHEYRAVLAHGAELYLRAMADALNATGTQITDYDVLIPHQANARIKAKAHEYKVPADKIYQNFDRVGNTANASTLLCLDEVADKGICPEGGLVLVAAAESTKWLYGSMVLRWSDLKGTGKDTKSKKDPLWQRLYMASIFFVANKFYYYNPTDPVNILIGLTTAGAVYTGIQWYRTSQ